MMQAYQLNFHDDANCPDIAQATVSIVLTPALVRHACEKNIEKNNRPPQPTRACVRVSQKKKIIYRPPEYYHIVRYRAPRRSHQIVDRLEGSVIGLLPLRDADADLLVTSYQQRLPTKTHQKKKKIGYGGCLSDALHPVVQYV